MKLNENFFLEKIQARIDIHTIHIIDDMNHHKSWPLSQNNSNKKLFIGMNKNDSLLFVLLVDREFKVTYYDHYHYWFTV